MRHAIQALRNAVLCGIDFGIVVLVVQYGTTFMATSEEARILEAEAVNTEGCRLSVTGESEAALRCFIRALELNPEPRYALSAASMHLKLGNSTLAVAMLEELVNSTDHQGRTPLTRSQLDLARRKLEAAHKMNGARSDHPMPHSSREWGTIHDDVPTEAMQAEEDRGATDSAVAGVCDPELRCHPTVDVDVITGHLFP